MQMVDCPPQRNLPERDKKWNGVDGGSDILKQRHCSAFIGRRTMKKILFVCIQTNNIPEYNAPQKQNNISVSKYVVHVIFLGLGCIHRRFCL